MKKNRQNIIQYDFGFIDAQDIEQPFHVEPFSLMEIIWEHIQEMENELY